MHLRLPHLAPRRGSFAVMTIDPQASLAPLNDRFLNDVVCPNFARKEYVVYVTDESPLGGGTMDDPTRTFHDYTVELVIEGIPPTSPEHCIDSVMSMPISPAANHPVRRTALQSSSIFPWARCYLSPFVVARVRSPTTISDAPVPHHLSIPEQLRHDKWFEEDHRRRAEGLAFRGEIASMFAHDFLDPQLPGVVSSTVPAVGSAVSESFWNASRSTSGSDDGVPDAGFEALVYGSGPATEPADPRGMYCNAQNWHGGVLAHSGLTVSFSHDLSRVTRPPSPLDFFAEAEKLKWHAIGSKLRTDHATEMAAADRYNIARRFAETSQPRTLARAFQRGKRVLQRCGAFFASPPLTVTNR
ncbi:hypothetical protein C8R46DRAFT_1303152 [Mycena filopes]|nr:hypothetical protein C8R46DRAFT_1303152 [Mycena filopes]